MTDCDNATPTAPCLALVNGKVPDCHINGGGHEYNRHGRCKHCKRGRRRCMADDLNEQNRKGWTLK